MKVTSTVFCISISAICYALSDGNHKAFQPTWDSLDSRKSPSWYDEAKVGIFLHWGVFSVPSTVSEWFWQKWKVRNDPDCVKFIDNNYPKGWSYQEFAKEFTAEFFDASEWAEIFEKSGAKYVVLTSKHHEGFTLWPSKYSFSWNAMDVGPHRDLIDELGTAVRQRNLTFGLYHSLYEWFNPMHLSDKASNFKQNVFVKNKIYPELIELVEKYKPEVLWSDGAAGPDTYWQSREFIAWLYNDSPVKDTIVVNDRWGNNNISCHHGDFYTCHDRYNPGTLQTHKWENAMTLDKHSWGFRRNVALEDYLTIEELLRTLAETISCGGNLLINVGPTKDGMINPIFQDRLFSLGSWLKVNGEAIYKSKPWKIQNDTQADVWYTSKTDAVYAIVLSWPKNDTLNIRTAGDIFQKNDVRVVLLGQSNKLKWTKTQDTINVRFPDKATVSSDWSWVLKITNY